MTSLSSLIVSCWLLMIYSLESSCLCSRSTSAPWIFYSGGCSNELSRGTILSS